MYRFLMPPSHFKQSSFLFEGRGPTFAKKDTKRQATNTKHELTCNHGIDAIEENSLHEHSAEKLLR